ncbi:enterochelin esterase [Prevotella communis]|uniref:Enterochelin esterase n=1 Tax=Prevotella communis TaxID=2913614 RepID=A0A1G7YAC5_9BACT|nr:alpha/beta hydrolase-fold protein [Prevotella communis]UKK58933.1 esterase [Prevotella communis]SDG93345.1 enterochelin esterase [Prevotella communis]
MKQFFLLAAVALTSMTASAQFGAQRGNPVVPSVKAEVEDFKPAVSNQENKQFPAVNSKRQVRAQIMAPNAKFVGLDIAGKIYEMTKDENGLWTGTSEPQDEGFHYYQLNIDGASVPDPASLYYYGASRWGSGIEVPSADQDFWQVKNVPQGSVSEVFYWSTYTEKMRRCHVYLPAEYYTNPTKKFPVLYLQHGMGENEYGWAEQGHTAQILDNLIAEGKAVPCIIVMDNGLNARRPGEQGGFGGPRPQRPQGGAAPQGQRRQGAPGQAGPRRGGFGGFGGFSEGFKNVLFNDIIPMVEKNYRVIADPQHRAYAGLSMGGMQAREITLANPEKFAYVGSFSSGAWSVDQVKNSEGFAKNVKLLFMSGGGKENMGCEEAAKKIHDELGMNAVGYESPGTAHEWHTWRRSLYQFAQLIFK